MLTAMTVSPLVGFLMYYVYVSVSYPSVKVCASQLIHFTLDYDDCNDVNLTLCSEAKPEIVCVLLVLSSENSTARGEGITCHGGVECSSPGGASCQFGCPGAAGKKTAASGERTCHR